MEGPGSRVQGLGLGAQGLEEPKTNSLKLFPSTNGLWAGAMAASWYHPSIMLRVFYAMPGIMLRSSYGLAVCGSELGMTLCIRSYQQAVCRSEIGMALRIRSYWYAACGSELGMGLSIC
eukprot:1183275-Rhodomonas_salina.1